MTLLSSCVRIVDNLICVPNNIINSQLHQTKLNSLQVWNKLSKNLQTTNKQTTVWSATQWVQFALEYSNKDNEQAALKITEHWWAVGCWTSDKCLECLTDIWAALDNISWWQMHCTNLDSHLLFNQAPPKLQPGSGPVWVDTAGTYQSLASLSNLGTTLKPSLVNICIQTIQHLSLRRMQQMLELCRYKSQWIKL